MSASQPASCRSTRGREALESADTVIALRTDQIARAVGAVLAQQRKHQKQAQQVAAAGGAVA